MSVSVNGSASRLRTLVVRFVFSTDVIPPVLMSVSGCRWLSIAQECGLMAARNRGETAVIDAGGAWLGAVRRNRILRKYFISVSFRQKLNKIMNSTG